VQERLVLESGRFENVARKDDVVNQEMERAIQKLPAPDRRTNTARLAAIVRFSQSGRGSAAVVAEKILGPGLGNKIKVPGGAGPYHPVNAQNRLVSIANAIAGSWSGL
jgi:hypothetical protein